MTEASLVTAVTVGVVLGIAGRFAITTARQVPFWLPITAAVGAAVLATIVTRMAGVDRPGPTLSEVLLEALLAAAGITLVAVTADRRRPSGRRNRRADAERHDHAGGIR